MQENGHRGTHTRTGQGCGIGCAAREKGFRVGGQRAEAGQDRDGPQQAPGSAAAGGLRAEGGTGAERLGRGGTVKTQGGAADNMPRGAGGGAASTSPRSRLLI